MRQFHVRSLALLGSVATAFLLSFPRGGQTYALIGGNLGISTSTTNGYQRDVRVFPNSNDDSADDNVAPNPSYPAALGSVMAVWKAARSWASDTPEAARNFDFDWQGVATSAGGSSDNVVSWISSCDSGTLAFMQGPISNGWTIKVCDNWVWSDGPGNPTGAQVDLQGVVAHELGHALGLGHSASQCGECNSAATMCPAICGAGVPQRGIAPDDTSGLQAIYGTVPSNKPKITSLSGSFATSQTLVIHGQNFASTVHVKFTAGTSTNTGTIPGVVFNVPSTSGGTQISVTIPTAAKDGNVLVWEPGLGRLSNAFPIDINGAPPVAPTITNVAPSSVAAFAPDTTITLTGSGFNGATQVNVGGVLLSEFEGFTVVDNNTITFPSIAPTSLGPQNVTVTVPFAGTSAPSTLTFVETVPPALKAQGLSAAELPFPWSFGGPANDFWFLSLAINDPATFPFGAYDILLNGQTYFTGVLSAAGVGGLTITIPPGLGDFTFYSQVVTFDGVSELHATNVTQTINLL